MPQPGQSQLEALIRLIHAAQSPSDQGRIVADFLLAWHNPAENGGFDPTALWRLQPDIARDITTVFALIAQTHKYPDELGFAHELSQIWKTWRTSGC